MKHLTILFLLILGSNVFGQAKRNDMSYDSFISAIHKTKTQPGEVYRVTGYKRVFAYGGTEKWERTSMKVRVTKGLYGGEKIEVLEWKDQLGYWQKSSNCIVKRLASYEDFADQFDYYTACGTLYFNI